MMMLVTGGTGLVGRQIVEDLLERGHTPDRIRVLVRPSSEATFLREKGVHLCCGDLLDMDSLRAALSGVRLVFHSAAVLMEKETETFWRVNLRGTENMLEAARQTGVEKVVHISTIGIYGVLRDIPASEDHPKAPLRPYAVTKLAAEEKVWEFFRNRGLKAVALRPTNIIGPGDRTITRVILRFVRRKIVPVIAGGRKKVSFVDVRDVSRAALLAGDSERAVGQAYNVEGFAAPLRDVLQYCIDLVGSGARLVSIPAPVAYVGAFLIDGFNALARPGQATLLARKGVQQLTQDLVFDTTKIRRDLNFQPRYGMEEAFRQTIQWQLNHGH